MNRTITILGQTIEARLDLGDEPRIEASDLGGLLEYGRPRDCRALIRRMLDEGRLTSADVYDATPRHGAAPTNSADNSKTSNEDKPDDARRLWLTERACLIVATASETDRAWQVRTALVDFFLAHRRGQTNPAPRPTAIDGESIFDQLFGAFDPNTMVREVRSDGICISLRRDLPKAPTKPRTVKKRRK